MLIDDEGRQHGIVNLDIALSMAEEKRLDLVQISNANEPVCKILDFGKYLYRKQKKEKQNKKNQHIIHVKEIRLRLNIG